MSKCDCIYIDAMDSDGPECFSETRPIAKKVHTCSECGRIIESGEEYAYETGKWNGEFEVYKTCEDCLSIREAMFCEKWEYTNLWNNLVQYLQDIDYEISEDCLLELTPRARNMILDIIDEA